MSASPYRDGDQTSPPIERRPIPWKRIGISAMIGSGFAAAADLLSAAALNIEAPAPVGVLAIRWIFVVCTVVFAVGATIVACEELK